ncbi:MAG TPA: ArsR family transcriptional regulator [Gordonia polyisoprenivorans]|uniref:Winged helix-turn-helix transcriptional regulator n=1 Tax=Gordonia polyisoprenivorans TaxID=84595 RepID=A0A846WNY7_9ACTN|nr:metalloregulator ArsR/SmtB family transcription factor [Gordonia polyisoprenivorans]MBE7193637.1 winged helix-turn-helix transcriptional regulator [Gordonia polyisoprenivorans]NKY03332.1 winged helix-turn-helix transcriptional regulator [Gordonia polyisoprenivorans]OZC31753.1 ArsR family transcriptional regulator [Gordonia polyisoprenivorans]QUD83882.1 winged helix-turn-helix transcriptional regulator [Gordonia polyisoprenivorans]UZF55113.1 metalloregulator ArsR/SmtB family transcription fa
MSTSGFSGTDQPLYEIKANLFKALAHPARIRVLEVLSANDSPTPVSELLTIIDIGPTTMSQHLAVLKRHHVVRSTRTGNAVFYTLAHPKVSELLLIARTFLSDTLDEQREQYDAISALPPVVRA